MAELFQRDWLVRLDTIEISKLDVAFQVEKSIKHEPNKCTLKVWNLSRDQRSAVEALSVRRKQGRGRIRVEIHAGYVGQPLALIFRGDLRSAKTEREGADLVTTCEGEDGGRSFLWSRINRSFPAGTRVEDVIRVCAEAMRVGTGNLDEITGARLETAGAIFPEGTVLSGSAPMELESVLRSVGLRYSVQDGVLQFLRRGRALAATAVVLSAATGLVDTPVKNADGTVTARALLIPELYPGRQVRFESSGVTGYFRVDRAKYTGETAAQDWYVDLETQPLVPVAA